MRWTFYNLWNSSLENREERLLKERKHIWASEMGGAMVDRFLKMNAVLPTNPPNPRSLRKFEAGNIWESIIGFVLSRAGILISKQTYLSYQYPNLLEVTGKLDYCAGGKPDYDRAKNLVSNEFNWLPEFISRATIHIVEELKEKYPDGLDEIVLEIKSCSSFMFELYEKKGVGSPNHKLQLFHYLKAAGKSEGHIVYVCKDDARLLEIGVANPSSVEDIYKMDIAEITTYIQANEKPPLEKPIVFDDEFGKFSANWKVAYSNYLTLLYGLENQFAFDSKFKPTVEKWNRVLGRVKNGDKMTDKNLEALDEISEAGFDIEQVKKAVLSENNITANQEVE
ncbi:MAG: hypothetical protein WC441_04725 [Patescibacteria group bacterium]